MKFRIVVSLLLVAIVSYVAYLKTQETAPSDVAPTTAPSNFNL